MSTINKILGTPDTQPETIEEMATRRDFVFEWAPARESTISKLLGQKVEEGIPPAAQKLINDIRYARKTGDKTAEMNAKSQLVRLVPNWKGIPEIVGALGESLDEALEVCDVVHMICGAAGDDKEALKKGLLSLSKGQLKRVYNAITGKDSKEEEGEEHKEGETKSEHKAHEKAETPAEEKAEHKEEKKEEKEEKKPKGDSGENATMAK